MILNLNNPVHLKEIFKYKKCKGIALVDKYFEDLSPLNKMYVINSLNDWKIVENEFPENMMTVRCDSLKVANIALPNGQSFDRNRVEDYIKEVKSIDDEAVIILEDLKVGTNERIYTDGGVNIEVKIGEYIHIEYVGQGFDCRELCIGVAVHEAWNIPWSEVPFLKDTSIKEYKIYETNTQNYLESVKERITFLEKAFPNMKEQIVKVIPKEYTRIKISLFRKIIDEIIFPLYLKKDQLIKDNLNFFGVEMNVVKNNKIVPMEIAIL